MPSSPILKFANVTWYCILYLPDDDNLKQTSRYEFLIIHDTQWKIETFHRAIKQVCGISRFMVRDSCAIKTHIFCSLRAFVKLELMRQGKIINNWYELQRNLFIKVAGEYICQNLNNDSIVENS